MIGVSFQQVQKYEGGSNRLSYSTLVSLARALGLPMETLTEGLNERGHVATQPTPFDTLLADTQALRLGLTFTKIKSQSVRKVVLKLVAELTGGK